MRFKFVVQNLPIKGSTNFLRDQLGERKKGGQLTMRANFPGVSSGRRLSHLSLVTYLFLLNIVLLDLRTLQSESGLAEAEAEANATEHPHRPPPPHPKKTQQWPHNTMAGTQARAEHFGVCTKPEVLNRKFIGDKKLVFKTHQSCVALGTGVGSRRIYAAFP